MRDIANKLAAENEQLKQQEALPDYTTLLHNLGKDGADCVIAERVKWADLSAELLSAAEGVLSAWERDGYVARAMSPLYGAVLDIKQIAATHNPDPEAKIETMIHELAYERVKRSYLFNALSNAQVDQKADELAAVIAPVVEGWIAAEVDAEAQRQNEMDEFVGSRSRAKR